MVPVLNHTECQCQCQWDTDKDCQAVNPNYVKSPTSCECLCPEEFSCDAYHEFDKESCACKCRKDKFFRIEQTCKQRGFVWNDALCKCDTVRVNVSAKEIRISNTN